MSQPTSQPASKFASIESASALRHLAEMHFLSHSENYPESARIKRCSNKVYDIVTIDQIQFHWLRHEWHVVAVVSVMCMYRCKISTYILQYIYYDLELKLLVYKSVYINICNIEIGFRALRIFFISSLATMHSHTHMCKM